MSLSTVRTEVKTLMAATSGIENVYDYRRYTRDYATYKDLFKEGSHINTWEITRPTFTRLVHGSDAIERVVHDFLIRGFYSLDDKAGSEKVFQDLVETVCQIFRDKPTLEGYAEVVKYPIVGRVYESMFGSVLCHIGEIEVHIQERIAFG